MESDATDLSLIMETSIASDNLDRIDGYRGTGLHAGSSNLMEYVAIAADFDGGECQLCADRCNENSAVKLFLNNRMPCSELSVYVLVSKFGFMVCSLDDSAQCDTAVVCSKCHVNLQFLDLLYQKVMNIVSNLKTKWRINVSTEVTAVDSWLMSNTGTNSVKQNVNNINQSNSSVKDFDAINKSKKKSISSLKFGSNPKHVCSICTAEFSSSHEVHLQTVHNINSMNYIDHLTIKELIEADLRTQFLNTEAIGQKSEENINGCCMWCQEGVSSSEDYLIHLHEKHNVSFNVNTGTQEKLIDEPTISQTSNPEMSSITDIKKPTQLDTYTQKRNAQWKCKECACSFKSRAQLDDHIISGEHKLLNSSGILVKDEIDDIIDLDSGCALDVSTSARTTTRSNWHCRVCGLNFNKRKNLESHKTECHPDFSVLVGLSVKTDVATLQLSCNTCGKDYLSSEEHESCQCINLKDDTPDSILVKSDTTMFQNKAQNNYCFLCEKGFARLAQLNKHNSIYHSQVRKYSCRYCDLKFKKRIALLRHESYAHSQKLVCNICGLSFKNKKVLRHHSQEEHHVGVQSFNSDLIKKFGCQVCFCFFDTKDELLEHVNKENHELPVEVEDNAVSSDKSPSVHLKGTRGKKTCKICGLDCASMQALLDHRSVAHEDGGVSVIECQFCSRRLLSAGALEVHLTVTHNRPPTANAAKPFKCGHCLFETNVATKLDRHTFEKHGVEIPRIECSFCGKLYAASYVAIHIANMHENKREHACKYCGMKFNVWGTMRTHVLEAHLGNTYRCDKCHLDFGKYYQLQYHRYRAHGAGAFPCLQCPAKFDRPCDLSLHVKRKHVSPEKFPCSYCCKVYSSNQRLRFHLMSKHNVSYGDTVSKRYRRIQRESHLPNIPISKRLEGFVKAKSAEVDPIVFIPGVEVLPAHSFSEVVQSLDDIKMDDIENELMDVHEDFETAPDDINEEYQQYSIIEVMEEADSVGNLRYIIVEPQ